MSLRRNVVFLLSLSLLAISCGKVGRPLPPEFPGPPPPLAVTVRQLGQVARVGFETGGVRGDEPAQQLVRAELVRVGYAPGADAALDADAFRRRGELVAEVSGEPFPSGERLSLEDRLLVDLPGGGVGWRLRYAVRTRDRRGRASALVVAPDLVVLAPGAAPHGLRAASESEGSPLVWSPPPGGSDLRYNVYRAPVGESWPDAPLNPEPLGASAYVDGTTVARERYAYSVRVVLAPGLPYRESSGSDPVEVVFEDRFAPAPPQGLVAVQEGPAVRLFWNPGRERDLVGYRVYRSIDERPWERVGPDPVREPLYLDPDVQAGWRSAYRVTAVDAATPPNESEPSPSVELEVAVEPVAGEDAE